MSFKARHLTPAHTFMQRVRPFLPPLLLFLLALVPRVAGLRWGLPNAAHWYSYHPDEQQISDAVTNLYGDGRFNPHFFNYPSLYIYLVYGAHFLASGLGWVQTASSAQPWPWLQAQGILLAGRVLTALLGAATVPLVYGMGRRVGGPAAGVWAALLLAFLPGHVQHSHFATVDVPATFFITLALWLAGRSCATEVAETQRVRYLLASALVAGLAAATKYNAGVVLVAPLMALYYDQGRSAWKRLGPLLAVAALGFLIGCPYSILGFREFWGTGYNGFHYEMFVHPREGSGDVFQGSGIGWWYHLTFNLPFVMTWPLVVAAMLGSVSTLYLRKQDAIAGSRSRVLLLVWIAAYFLPLGFSQVRYMRYVLPLTPALCLMAVSGVQYAMQGIPATMASRVSHGLLCLVALIGTVNVVTPLVATDPRDQAARFMLARTTTGASVGLLTLPWFWTPPLTPLPAPPPTVPSAGLLLQLSDASRGRYRFVVTGFEAAALGRDKPPWFVVDELEWRDQARLDGPEYKRFRERLEADYALGSTFKTPVPLAWPGRNFVPHDYLYTNPEIRVYQRR